MRQGLSTLLLALSPCLLITSALAEETPSSIIAIDDALFSKHTELKDAQKARDEQQKNLDSQKQALQLLEKEAKSADTQFIKAKTNLERDYLRMIDEPDLDLSTSQSNYQNAWASVKQNQKARLDAEQTLQDLQVQLIEREAQVDAVQANIDALGQNKVRARVERLKTELKQSSEEKVMFTNVCQSDMTLAQCSNQTTELAIQKAVKQFQNTLIDQTTESSVVKQNLANVSLNIHVLRHAVSESGFYDGIRFKTVMDVSLEARPSESASCKLLGVESKYCFAPGSYNEQQSKQLEVAWVNLSIRSNQYDDKVTVDGVTYGSTPVEVMLPVGPHMVTVEKEGYRSFHQELKVASDHTLRAVLREYENRLQAGDKFADKGKTTGQLPELVTLVPGQYLVGENASKQVNLDHAFAIGATLVTVNQFDAFVDSTNYQTDAEFKNTCTTIKDSEITPISKSYWRNPGFKQFSNSPAVCVSLNDAKAYARWLSAETGYNYRLPSEDEWEIAALAGSESRYWWGDKFESGKANTGWSGTPWSNTSTSPVSAFRPNPLGLYDMVGNVWQWTQDGRGLVKGGAWNYAPTMAQAHQRMFLSPSSAANYVGFRVVRELD